MSGEETRAGFVALIGAPNADKSTLINRLVGAKVAIATNFNPGSSPTMSMPLAIAAAGNALMHSGADRIRIYLIVSGFLLVQISDNGCGIADWPDPAVRGRRLGFAGMLARARRQNGRILVETLEGNGTEIVAQLELDFNPLFTQEVGEQA